MSTVNPRDQRFASFTLAGSPPIEVAIRAEEVLEATPITGKIRPLPAGIAYLEGFMHLRDAVIPIINMKKRLGLPKTDYTDDAKIAVVTFSQSRFGLLFDDIKEVLAVNEKSVHPVHPALQTPQSILTDLIEAGDGQRTVELLDVDRLFQNSDSIECFQGIEAPTKANAAANQPLVFRHVVFSCKKQKYGINVDQVQEIAYLEEIDEVFKNDLIEGVVPLRGVHIPVLNAVRLFGAGSDVHDFGQTARVLVLKADNFQYGLIVDSVDALLSIYEDEIKPLPTSGNGTVTGIYQQTEKENIMLLRMDPFVEGIQDHLRAVNNRSGVGAASRMEAASSQTRHLITADCYLIFSIGKNFAIALKDVQEILETGRLMTIPAADGSGGCLLNLRGNVVPVLDLRAFYGYPLIEKMRSKKLVVARYADRVVALVVDDICTIYKQVRFSKTPSLNPQLNDKQDTLDRLIEFVDKSGKKEHVLVLNVAAIIRNHLDMALPASGVDTDDPKDEEKISNDNKAE